MSSLSGYSFISNQLNDLHNQLNQISICQSKLFKDLEKSLQQFDQSIEKCEEEKDLNKTKEMISHFENVIHLLVQHFNEDNIQEKIEFIEKNISQLVQSLEKVSSSIEEKNISSLNIIQSSLNNCNEEEEEYSYRFHLSVETSLYPDLINSRKRIEVPCDDCLSFSTNEKYFLIIGKFNFYLFNHKFQIVKKKYFSQGKLIKDISWSKTLKRFLLISSAEIFIFDPEKMILKPYQFYFNPHKCWQRLTCSQNSLFISTYGENPFIIQLNLFPSIQFSKKLQKGIISNCNPFINDIKYFEENLILIVEDHLNNQSLFKIYSLKSSKIIQTTNLGFGWNYRSSLFNNRYWIISDSYNKRFLHLNNEGFILKIESYFSKPLNIISWNHNQLIVQTDHYFNIHQSQ